MKVTSEPGARDEPNLLGTTKVKRVERRGEGRSDERMLKGGSKNVVRTRCNVRDGRRNASGRGGLG